MLLKVPVKTTDQCVVIKGVGKLYCYYLFYNDIDSENGQGGTSKTGPWQWTPGAAKKNGCASDVGKCIHYSERTFKQEYFSLR